MLGKVLVANRAKVCISGYFLYTEAGAMVIEPEEMPWALHLEDLKWAMALQLEGNKLDLDLLVLYPQVAHYFLIVGLLS